MSAILLLFVYLIGLGICAGLGFIPANIAKKKGYSFGLFWLFGFGVLPAAIIVACCLPNKNAPADTRGTIKTEAQDSINR